MLCEHLHLHDSGVEPTPLTLAQEAFFRYHYTLGSYEYTRRNGRGARLEIVGQELAERYEAYTTIRDGRPVARDVQAMLASLPSALARHRRHLPHGHDNQKLRHDQRLVAASVRSSAKFPRLLPQASSESNNSQAG